MTTIYVRLSRHAHGEFLSAHRSRDAAISMWAASEQVEPENLTLKEAPYHTKITEIYHDDNHLGNILAYTLGSR